MKGTLWSVRKVIRLKKCIAQKNGVMRNRISNKWEEHFTEFEACGYCASQFGIKTLKLNC